MATQRKPKKATATKRRHDDPDGGPHDVDVQTVAAIMSEAEAAAARAKAPTGEELPSAAAMAKLAGVEVEELDGSWIKFGAIWEASPAALVFLRHYG